MIFLVQNIENILNLHGKRSFFTWNVVLLGTLDTQMQWMESDFINIPTTYALSGP